MSDLYDEDIGDRWAAATGGAGNLPGHAGRVAGGGKVTIDTGQVDLLSRYPVPRHRLTRDDYYRMGEAGILGERDRVELLDGQLVDMSPIRPRHALVVDALTELLITAFTGRARVRVQNPVVLDNGSEPQPDVALVRFPWHGHPQSHPEPADIFLLIEVADSSLDLDRRVKLALYARAGIREVWIVDLTTDAVLVHRDPSGGQYGSVSKVEAPAVVDVQDLPGTTIPVAALFA
jgi:Uma2 family endonuclease